MIDRYEDPTIAAIWGEKAQLHRWYEIERTWLYALFGIQIPPLFSDAAEALLVLCKAEEAVLHHDVAAFVKALEAITGVSRVHFGLTSSDVVDTALMMGMNSSTAYIAQLIDQLHAALLEQRSVTEFSGLRLVPARTHGMIAEPMAAVALHDRWIGEVNYVTGVVGSLQFYGKLSGSVGCHQGLPDMAGQFREAERLSLAERLGLTVCKFSTQVIPRELFLDVFMALLKTSSVLTRMATQLRLFASHGELRRVAGDGERGSSSMPHKVNPIGFEKVCGLHRLVEAAMMTASQNCILWAERDISHSSVERLIIPDVFHVVAHQLSTMIKELRSWRFDAEAIEKLNLHQYRTQAAMLTSILDGKSREAAFNEAKPV